MAEPLGLREVRRALAEDGAREDVTTALLGEAAELSAVLRFVAEARCVAAGVGLAGLVFRELDPGARMGTEHQDGDVVDAGETIVTAHAAGRVLLAGERVALNFMQRLSGIATRTREAVDAVAGTGTRITHTRKTTPGLRALELHAVRLGGGVPNRASLAEAVLWKDNHWELAAAGGVTLRDALAGAPADVPVMVEVESEEQLEQAVAAGVTHVLADNQPPARIAEWVRRYGGGLTIEASGGISAINARAYAEAGAHLISVGALTHSAAAVPIRCDLSGYG